MKKVLGLLICLFLTIGSFAQQRVELDNQYTSITLTGNLRAKIYRCGDSAMRTYATLYGIDAQRLKWSQKGDAISFSLPSGLVEGDSYGELEIYCNGLTRLVCEGATVECMDTLVSDNIYIEALSSINSLNLLLDVKELQLKAAASANIQIGGRAQWATILANMGARVNCSRALFDDCTVKAGENSEVVVRVATHLDARASTKATIFYFGSPTTQIKSSLGGGVTPVVPPAQQ